MQEIENAVYEYKCKQCKKTRKYPEFSDRRYNVRSVEDAGALISAAAILFKGGAGSRTVTSRQAKVLSQYALRPQLQQQLLVQFQAVQLRQQPATRSNALQHSFRLQMTVLLPAKQWNAAALEAPRSISYASQLLRSTEFACPSEPSHARQRSSHLSCRAILRDLLRSPQSPRRSSPNRARVRDLLRLCHVLDLGKSLPSVKHVSATASASYSRVARLGEIAASTMPLSVTERLLQPSLASIAP